MVILMRLHPHLLHLLRWQRRLGEAGRQHPLGPPAGRGAHGNLGLRSPVGHGVTHLHGRLHSASVVLQWRGPLGEGRRLEVQGLHRLAELQLLGRGLGHLVGERGGLVGRRQGRRMVQRLLPVDGRRRPGEVVLDHGDQAFLVSGRVHKMTRVGHWGYLVRLCVVFLLEMDAHVSRHCGMRLGSDNWWRKSRISRVLGVVPLAICWICAKGFGGIHIVMRGMSGWLGCHK